MLSCWGIAFRNARLVSVLLTTAVLCSSSNSLANSACENQFQSFDGHILTKVPDYLNESFQALPQKERQRFQLRFFNRDKIRAHAEAARLVSTLMGGSTYVPLRTLLQSESHLQRSITEVLQHRLNQDSQRVKIENTLLELGYRPESDRRAKVAHFQRSHFRQLESLKRFAVNSATTFFAGIPLLLGRFQYQRFNFQTLPSTDPKVREILEKEIRGQQERIDSKEPELIREIKRELAIELARRILVVGVFTMVTNEILELAFPGWAIAKAEFWNPVSNLDRAGLEQTALENWRELYEAFSGEKLDEKSPAFIETRERIRRASNETLKAHVNQGSPLPD